SALATRLLARSDAHVVTVVGTGVQARAHAQALIRLAGVTVIRIAGRNRAKVEMLAEELNAGGIPTEPMSSIEEAVSSADIVCAATHPQAPVVLRRWLRPGTHVNSVGYNAASTGEVDVDTVRDALVVVESREAILAPPPSGAVEIRRAVQEGVISAADLIEIGELAGHRAAGRGDVDQLTLYKSIGVAAQDAAAAALILSAARERRVGTTVDV
ncbi:MAG: ornithine cyclodeaminase, partial [Pseudonocardiales bacterium]|nr:ornithine cyclodeaminase [Pseudonocardiales bacterium]